MDKKKLGTAVDIQNQKVMLRDFIHDRLYQQPGGYFSKTEH